MNLLQDFVHSCSFNWPSVWKKMDKVTAIVVLVFMASRTSKGFQGKALRTVKFA